MAILDIVLFDGALSHECWSGMLERNAGAECWSVFGVETLELWHNCSDRLYREVVVLV